MFKINDNFCKLPESYLFSEVARRINAFKDANPEADVIRMGIGDVTLPLCSAAIEAMHRASTTRRAPKPSMATDPNRGIPFCARPSLKTITGRAGLKSPPTRFS